MNSIHSEVPSPPSSTPSLHGSSFHSTAAADSIRSSSIPNFGGHPTPPVAKSSDLLHPAVLGRHSSGPRPSSFTQHPMFQSLSPREQQQIVLSELQAAREAVTSAELAAFRHYQYQDQNQQRLLEHGQPFPHGYYDRGQHLFPVKGIDTAHHAREASLTAMIARNRMLESDWPRTVASASSPQLLQKRTAVVMERPSSAANVSNGTESDFENAGNEKDESASRGPRLKRLKLRMQEECVP